MVSHAASYARGESGDPCPHIEHNDDRCAHRFSLPRLDQAFGVCLGAYHGCPMFHRLNREADARISADSLAPLITITTHGRRIALRPTGT